MKHTGKIAVGGIISALALAVMFLSWFPYLTYAVPAIAGVILIVIVIEIDFKWAMLVYGVISVLSLFMMETDAKIMFIFFFGYYPIIKFKIDKIKQPVFKWISKIVVFNVAVILAYCVIIYIFQVPFEEMGAFGKWTAAVMLGVGNIAFVIYDMAIGEMIFQYMRVLHPRIKNILRF